MKTLHCWSLAWLLVAGLNAAAVILAARNGDTFPLVVWLILGLGSAWLSGFAFGDPHIKRDEP